MTTPDALSIVPLQDGPHLGTSPATSPSTELRSYKINFPYSANAPVFVPSEVTPAQRQEIANRYCDNTPSLLQEQARLFKEAQTRKEQIDIGRHAINDAKKEEQLTKNHEFLSVIAEKVNTQKTTLIGLLAQIQRIADKLSIPTVGFPLIDPIEYVHDPHGFASFSRMHNTIDQLIEAALSARVRQTIKDCIAAAKILDRNTCSIALANFNKVAESLRSCKEQVNVFRPTNVQPIYNSELISLNEHPLQIKQDEKATKPDVEGFKERNMDLINEIASSGRIDAWIAVILTLELTKAYGKLTANTLIHWLPAMMATAAEFVVWLYAAEVNEQIKHAIPRTIDKMFGFCYGCHSCTFATYMSDTQSACPRCAMLFDGVSIYAESFVQMYFELARDCVARAAAIGQDDEINIFGYVLYYYIFLDQAQTSLIKIPNAHQFATEINLVKAVEISLETVNMHDPSTLEYQLAHCLQNTVVGTEAHIRKTLESVKQHCAGTIVSYSLPVTATSVAVCYEFNIAAHANVLWSAGTAALPRIYTNADWTSFTTNGQQQFVECVSITDVTDQFDSEDDDDDEELDDGEEHEDADVEELDECFEKWMDSATNC